MSESGPPVCPGCLEKRCLSGSPLCGLCRSRVEKSCRGKRRFASKAKAMEAVGRHAVLYGTAKVPYSCKVCSSYHNGVAIALDRKERLARAVKALRASMNEYDWGLVVADWAPVRRAPVNRDPRRRRLRGGRGS